MLEWTPQASVTVCAVTDESEVDASEEFRSYRARHRFYRGPHHDSIIAPLVQSSM